MTHRLSSVAVMIGVLFLLVGAHTASGDDYYKGKNIRIIVGFSAGGGYDTYTRTIARHMSRFISGDPTILVENMTGAGSLLAANYIYSRAEPDGLTAGVFNNSLIVQKGLGDSKIKIDFQKYGWIGTPSKGVPVCMIMGFTGYKTLDDVLKADKPIKMGATRAGSTGHNLPIILNQTIGSKFDVITGYKGTSRIRVALQGKEIDGFCSQRESMRVTARSLLDASGDDKLIPFVVHTHWADPEVKDLPLFGDAIKNPNKYAVYSSWAAQMEFQRPIMLPPRTPKERLATLRQAFKATLEDTSFQAEAKKSKLVVNHVSGEEVEKYVNQILNMPPDVKESLRFLVQKKKK